MKPCARCSIPGVDPDTGVQGHAVTDALAGYRADPRMEGAVTFGMNAIVTQGLVAADSEEDEPVLRVSQPCQVIKEQLD